MVFAITSVVRGYHAYKDIWDAEIDSAFRLRSSSATYLDFHVLISLAWPDRFLRAPQRASRSDKKTVWPRETMY